MKSMRLSALAALLCLALACAWAPAAQAAAPAGGRDDASQWAARLVASYPGVTAVRGNLVYFSDGTSLPFSDGRDKTFAQRLERASIADMFFQPYPALAPIAPPPPNFDPGRFRCDAFFRKLYGSGKKAVEANLTKVRWLPRHGGRTLLFNQRQNAAAQLRKVSAELDRLPERYMKFVVNIAGTFQYRPIKATKRLSPHSYGIAIDLPVKNASYWLWDKRYKYENRIPKAIVDVFERHGFIWGGRWYHYDTMHFEYRPELFARVEGVR